MGLIVEIGNQVLSKACLECQRWPGETAVAVNLSPIQFDRSNVPALVRETLAATKLAAHRLELEITESTLLQDTKRTRAELEQLAEIGVKISLDDFGTAYSSLSYLHSFPLHKVKIDQLFLRGIGDDERKVTLLRGITRLSAQLGLRVVVEGVETQEQLELLDGRGTRSTRFKVICSAGRCLPAISAPCSMRQPVCRAEVRRDRSCFAPMRRDGAIAASSQFFTLGRTLDVIHRIVKPYRIGKLSICGSAAESCILL